jgi:hypothetical protein
VAEVATDITNSISGKIRGINDALSGSGRESRAASVAAAPEPSTENDEDENDDGEEDMFDSYSNLSHEDLAQMVVFAFFEQPDWDYFSSPPYSAPNDDDRRIARGSFGPVFRRIVELARRAALLAQKKATDHETVASEQYTDLANRLQVRATPRPRRLHSRLHAASSLAHTPPPLLGSFPHAMPLHTPCAVERRNLPRTHVAVAHAAWPSLTAHAAFR